MSFLLKKYDTLIALAVLAGVAASAFLLWRGFGARVEGGREFTQKVNGMAKLHPTATAADIQPYDDSAARLANPPRLSLPGRDASGFFIPDVRVWCPRCFRPIPEKSEKCPPCGATQIQKEVPDDYLIYGDNCPITYGWVKKYGLDPANPADADADFDNDGFTNLEEFLANTDPTDPKSHPPIETKLELVGIVSKPVGLIFMDSMRMSDDTYRCNVKDAQGDTFTLRITEDDPEPHSMGDRFLKTHGYKAVALEILSVKRPDPMRGEGATRDVDVSKLTLLRVKDGTRIVLTRDDPNASEVFATLALPLDNLAFEDLVKGASFTLREIEFGVIEIDSRKETVALENKAAKKRFTVSK